MKNLENLSGPRTIFLFDLFTHKKIDICSHIYHLFVKSIKKRNSRLTPPFPSLVMSLILRARVKIPIGLQVMQREDPISEQTMIRSKAHIPEPSIGFSQIPRVDAAKEGGDTEEETALRFSFGGHCTSFFPCACKSTRSSWSSNRKGWRVACNASFPYQCSTSQFTYLEG